MKKNIGIRLSAAAKVLPVFILAVFILTSCSGAKKSQPVAGDKDKASVTPTSQATTSVENGSNSGSNQLMSTLNELFTKEHQLEIQKKGESQLFKASELTKNAVLDIFLKAENINPVVGEDIPELAGYDYQKYDYKLKFSGFKEILLSLDDSTFHFEGEKPVYKLWGDSSSFWQQLKIDNGSKTADIGDKPVETLVQNYKEDIDGNGTLENIQLAFRKSMTMDSNGELVLRVNGNETVVEKNIGWGISFAQNVNQQPALSFLPKSDNRGKALVISYAWATNGVGSTGVILVFDYKNGLFEKKKIDLPQMSFAYLGEGNVNIGFPELGVTEKSKISDEDVKYFTDNSNEDIKSVLKNNQFFYPHPFQYAVNDFNGDGLKELFSVNLIRIEVPPRLVLGNLYTFYKYNENGKIVPVKVIVRPPYRENDREHVLKTHIYDLIIQSGHITIGDKALEDSIYSLPQQYRMDEFIESINEMSENNLLKKSGAKVYIDF